jgi:hypothetical protein
VTKFNSFSPIGAIKNSLAIIQEPVTPTSSIETGVNISTNLSLDINNSMWEEERRRFEEMKEELNEHKTQAKEIEMKLQEERHQVEIKNAKIRSLEEQFSKKVGYVIVLLKRIFYDMLLYLKKYKYQLRIEEKTQTYNILIYSITRQN